MAVLKLQFAHTHIIPIAFFVYALKTMHTSTDYLYALLHTLSCFKLLSCWMYNVTAVSQSLLVGSKLEDAGMAIMNY